jgi:hypothetical protein
MGERSNMTEAFEDVKEDGVIAFLDVATFEDGEVIRGGCLVTDSQTRPLEFRVSGAIHPTKLQRVLYGRILREYVCNELVGLPIIQSLESQPDVVLVRDSVFLTLRPQVTTSILLIRSSEEGEIQFRAFPGYEQQVEDGQRVLPRQLKGKMLLEPFMRIRRALAEAHKLKLGEK